MCVCVFYVCVGERSHPCVSVQSTCDDTQSCGVILSASVTQSTPLLCDSVLLTAWSTPDKGNGTCDWWAQPALGGETLAPVPVVWNRAMLQRVVLKQRIDRPRGNQTLLWLWSPRGVWGEPTALVVTPPLLCATGAVFVADWSAPERPWLAGFWGVFLFVYQLGWAVTLWTQYHRLGVIVHASLLAMHLPILVVLRFNDYCVATFASMATMLSLVGILFVKHTWCTPPDKFRLMRTHQANGLFSVVVFIAVHALVLLVALIVRR
jgi:hypothetical protein